jgi:hypothetical protein
MGKKRGVGNRAQIYFDSIDLEILEFLNHKNRRTMEGAYSILDLIEHIKINSKSLKPHIDKLLSLGLLETIPMSYAGNIKGCEDDIKYDGKGGLTTPTISFNFYKDIDYYMDSPENEEKFVEHEQKSKEFEKLLSDLRSVRAYYFREQQKKSIYIDLRSKETIKNFSKLKGLKPIDNLTKKEIDKNNKESNFLTEQDNIRKKNFTTKKNNSKK